MIYARSQQARGGHTALAAHQQGKPGTATHILDVAELLVQARGFNAFRPADIRLFDQSETWLRGVLERGQEEGSLQLAGSARQAAQMITSGIEGAMLVAAPYGDTGRFQAAA